MLKMLANFRNKIACFVVLLASCWLTSAYNVEEIHENELDKLVQTHKYAFVLFTSPSCDACQQWHEALDMVMQHVAAQDEDLRAYRLSSETHSRRYGVLTYPKLLYFRKGVPILYPGGGLESTLDWEEGVGWMQQVQEPFVRNLGDEDFEHLTQAGTGATTGDWLVIFYEPECAGMLPTFEAVANSVKHKVNVAAVDTMANTKLHKRFSIVDCPSIYLFRLGSMYRYNLPHINIQSLVQFSEGWYKNHPKRDVPGEASPFDDLTDNIAKSLKNKVAGGGSMWILASVAFSVLLIIFCGVLCCRKRGKKEHFY